MSDVSREAHEPPCREECVAVMRQWILDGDPHQTEVTISHMPPVVVQDHPPIVLTCPHGVKWYASPTTEQIVAWAEAGVF